MKDNHCCTCHPDYVSPVPFTSKVACEFFDALEQEVGEIQHQHLDKENKIWIGEEFRIPGYRRKAVDGKIAGQNVVIEFLGDIWHGHPRLWEHDLEAENYEGRRYFDMFEKTQEIMKTVSGFGYEVWFIWETDFRKWDKTTSLMSCCSIFKGELFA